MNDNNKQFLTRHADALRMLREIPDDGKFTDAQVADLTTHPKRAIRIAGNEGCDCTNLTKLVEAIESRDFAALGDLIEPARLEIYGMIDETFPTTKNANRAPIDLDFARRAAAKSQAKRDEEAKRFEEREQRRRASDRYEIAWTTWSGTWENIVLSNNGNLIGEAGKEDLTAALNGLVEVIRDHGFINNLPIAVERFDPSYCDGTDDEEEADAVKILLCALNAVAGDTDAGEVAEALLAIEPLPLLFRAGSARRLLRIADHWPNHCEHCGRIQPPYSFDRNRCPDCSSTEGTLVALFNHIRRVNSEPGKQESSTDRLFPFWCDWRMQLQSAFPGADGDMAIMHKWVEYLTTTKGIERHGWQFIKFADAAKLLLGPLAERSGAIVPPDESICLARDQHSIATPPSQASEAVAVNFRPEDCDDDLWFQLDVLIRAMERERGGPYRVIESWKIGTETDAKYLKGIGKLTKEAGWKPFVFSVENGLKVLRVGGGEVFYRRNPGSYSRDEVGGEAVLSALRAWRERRAGELQRSGSTGTQEKPEAKTKPKRKRGQRKHVSELRPDEICGCLMDARIWDLWQKSSYKGKTGSVQLFLQKYDAVNHTTRSFEQLRLRIQSRKTTPGYSLAQLETLHKDENLSRKNGNCECYDINT